jgi:hypothetical protein
MAKSKIQAMEKDVAVLEEKVQEKLLKVVDKMTELGLREYTRYLSSPGRVFLMNLLAGVARGFGFFLGATVVVAIVTVVLTKILGSIPWLTDFVQWVQQALDPANLKAIQNFDFLKDAQGNIVEIVPKISK